MGMTIQFGHVGCEVPVRYPSGDILKADTWVRIGEKRTDMAIQILGALAKTW